MSSENATTLGVDDLAQEIRRIDGNHDLGAGALAEALMPFLVLRSKPVASGVVKPLEWQKIFEWGHDLKADTVIGGYTISIDSPGAGGASNLWMAGADTDTFEVFKTLREAKAAAEADYRNRIMLALEPATAPMASEPVAHILPEDLARLKDGESIVFYARDRDHLGVPLFTSPQLPEVTEEAAKKAHGVYRSTLRHLALHGAEPLEQTETDAMRAALEAFVKGE